MFNCWTGGAPQWFPTDAGERLLEAGKAILQICNKVKGELETIARPKLLRIGIPQSFSSRHRFQSAGFLPARHPHVAIEVSDVSSELLVELLAERQLDAVLTILDDSAAKFAEPGSLQRTICVGRSIRSSISHNEKA